MTQYTSCKVLNHTVEFKMTPTSGYISVGVDGRLVGNYPTVREALFEAAEHVRMVEHARVRPTIPEETWLAVEEFAAPAPVMVEVLVCHDSSIAHARWCRPVGWSPRNRVEGADWDDADGVWIDEDGEAAGIVLYGHDDANKGDTVAARLDDMRVVSCGDCRVLGSVEIDFS